MPVAGTGADAGVDKSSSEIHATEVPVSHVLTISGYSQSKSVAPRQYISSSFTAAGHRWSILYYPNGSGSTDTDAEYIALFVSCADTDVKARSTLCLLDKEGEVAHTCKTQFYTHMSGVSRFISRWDLERSGHLQDDPFRIRFDISVMKLAPKEEDATVAKFVDVLLNN
jgi:speckle-type POZ protein